MKIIRDEKYLLNLKNIMEFIAEDSLKQALKFQIELDKKIINLSYMPYKFKQSIYFNHENIRDFIYKGYVIPYKIDTDEETITIIGINKYKRDL